ncbi:smalltalk protein [Phocaeicola sp.]
MRTSKSTWGMILKVIIAVATSIASVVGITSCIN